MTRGKAGHCRETRILARPQVIAPIIADLCDKSDGAVLAHGQGALWGGLFAHEDVAARTAANVNFKKKCAERGVLPYFVPVGGFMLTPRYDDDPELLADAVSDVAACALETARDMGWAKARLLPSAYETMAPDAPAKAARFKGPEIDAMAPDRAAQGCEHPNFKGSHLGRFPLVLADFWTSDHLSARSRSMSVVSRTRARGTAKLKRR